MLRNGPRGHFVRRRNCGGAQEQGIAEKRRIYRPSRIFRRGIAGARQKLQDRPLLASGCDTDKLWDDRKPLYEEVADVIVDVREKGTACVAHEITEILKAEGVYRA